MTYQKSQNAGILVEYRSDAYVEYFGLDNFENANKTEAEDGNNLEANNLI